MARLDVRKTAKLYIGGAFPRSESGRSYPAVAPDGTVLSRVSWASRKDLRDAVRAARKAQPGWAERSGYNRGQVLYRIAEMLEDRAGTFVDTLTTGGSSGREARTEVATSIDRLVWYAGWCDKFAQTYGNLNPVAGPFFNLSAPEPVGVVGVVAAEEPALLGLVSRVAPALVPGNALVVLASESQPLPAVAFTEVLATSDVPGGVINLLTGPKSELLPVLCSHMDVQAVDLAAADNEMVGSLEELAAENVKRIVGVDGTPDWLSARAQHPLLIAALTETKTVWHPKGL
jgi:acyl-CoA reductase-like NAD-dependent aldehyde dehydrogenase